jgi:hypothetical protein
MTGTKATRGVVWTFLPFVLCGETVARRLEGVMQLDIVADR